MPLRLLVVPDKFKGTLPAAQVARAIANGWHAARPEDTIECLPMSDGGDGFGEILSRLIGAEEQAIETVDAAHRPRRARWWWHSASGTAIIESAEIVGLALLPPGRYHPFELDTHGLGAALRAAWDAPASQVIVGVGGSATNDAGFGMARAIGWRFFNRQGAELDRWTHLSQLASWKPSNEIPPTVSMIVAVDVENPLLGLQGCTRIYGPQKGLRVEQAPLAEANLERLAAFVRQECATDVASEPGAGAAGGLGFGLRVFAGARIESGFDLFALHAGLEARIQAADLVLTGEGMIDRQTLMGKGTGRVAQCCRAAGKPCIGIAGTVDGATHVADPNRLFHALHSLAPGMTSLAEAKAEPAKWLERIATRIATDVA